MAVAAAAVNVFQTITNVVGTSTVGIYNSTCRIYGCCPSGTGN